MSTPEGKVKNWCKNYLAKNLEGAIVYSPPGGAFGKAGEPDLHVVYGGAIGVIEVKAWGHDPTPLQLMRLRKYRDAGALAMLLRGNDVGKMMAFVTWMKERAACLTAIIGQQNQG